MNNNQSDPSQQSLLRSVARVAAVVMAIGIVSYLVWDAQQEAQPQLGPAPSVPADGDAPTQQQAGGQDASQGVLLPSSKSDVLLPSSKFAPVDFFGPASTNHNGGEAQQGVEGDGVLLSGSKSGLLPSSKVIVLPSSKSGRPMRPDMDNPEVKKPLDAIEKEKAATKEQANAKQEVTKR